MFLKASGGVIARFVPLVVGLVTVGNAAFLTNSRVGKIPFKTPNVALPLQFKTKNKCVAAVCVFTGTPLVTARK